MPEFAFNPPANHKIDAKAVRKVGHGYFIPGFGYTVMDASVGKAGEKDETGKPLYAGVPDHFNLYPNAVERKVDSMGFRGGFISHPDENSMRRRAVEWEFKGSPTFPNGIPVGYTEIHRGVGNGRLECTDAERDFGIEKWEQLKCIAHDLPYMSFREKLRDEGRKRAAKAAKQQRDLELISAGTSETGQVAELTKAVLEQNRILTAQLTAQLQEQNAKAAPVAAGAGGK